MQPPLKPSTNIARTHEDRTPVVFCLHDAKGDYWLNTATALTSLVFHASIPLHVHIYHDATLTTAAKERLTTISHTYGHPLTFTHITLPQGFSGFNFRHFSPASVFRLMIPRLLADQDIVVYLDSDLVLNQIDIAELIRAMPTNIPIGGVVDPFFNAVQKKDFERLGIPADEYINSGVLVIRPRLITTDAMEAALHFYQQFPDQIHFDQDFINFAFRGRIARLDERFNYQVTIFDRRVFQTFACYSGKILHFCGKTKPLSGHISPAYLHFWRYTMLTPEIAGFPLQPHFCYLLPLKTDKNGVKLMNAFTEREP